MGRATGVDRARGEDERRPMKTTRYLLALSLAVNLVLCGLILAGIFAPSPAPVAVVKSPTKSALAATPSPGADTWPRLDTPAAVDLVARLRAAGFPTDVIRAILDGRFESELSARIKALDPEASHRPFWKNSPQQVQVQATIGRLRRAHEKEMRALLGEQEDTSQLVNRVLPGRRVDGLPPEKAAAVLDIVGEFDEKRAEYFADPLYLLNPERRTALEREQRAALARLLTPQELEEYELRNGTTAMAMRMQLGAFEPTEAEFRAIFRLRNEFAQQYGSTTPVGATPAEIQARREAERRVTEQIQAALGPARAEDYLRKADYTYVQTGKIIERLQQPRENVDAVMAVSRDIVARARTLEADRSLSGPARSSTQAALYEEAARRLTPLLGGSTGFEVYRQYGGTWLESIKPRPPSATPTKPPPRP